LRLNSGTLAEDRATAGIELGAGLGATALSEHAAAVEIALSLSVAPETEASGIPDAEVWAEIPLALGLLADIEAEHEVAVEIPLSLGAQPETESPTVPDAEVWAEIPLGLGLGAGRSDEQTCELQ